MAGVLTTYKPHGRATPTQLIGERQAAEQVATTDMRAAVYANRYAGGTARLIVRLGRSSAVVS